MTTPLAGWVVLVTRPAGRHASLCDAIAASGGRAVHLPGVEIEAIDDVHAAAALTGLGRDDWIIFVSPASVQHARDWLDAVPEGVRLAAVGESTADALIEAGARGVLTPARGGSEALLAVLPRAAVAGQQVLIVRGEGGREKLARELEAAGAGVSYLEVYRRHRPRRAPDAALAAIDEGGVNAVCVSSGEILDNLLELVGERRQTLLPLPLVVPSKRVAARARDAGFSGEVAVSEANDDAVLATLIELHDKIE